MVDFIKEVEKITGNKNLSDRFNFNDWSKDKDCKGNPLYNILCPDIYAGKVDNGVIEKWISKEERKKKIKVKNGRHIQSYDFSKLDPTNRNSIVIILESPHKNEYELDQLWDKPNPAMGTTGTKLGNNIGDLIKAVSKTYPQINRGKYQIVLMNSIQYQCSLGVTPLDVTVRDFVFSQIWKLIDEIRESFVTRLKSYKPKFIFNLCTMGKVVPHLDFLVQALINDKYLKDNKVNLFVGNHPSGWRKGNKFVYDVREPYKDIIKF